MTAPYDSIFSCGLRRSWQTHVDECGLFDSRTVIFTSREDNVLLLNCQQNIDIIFSLKKEHWNQKYGQSGQCRISKFNYFTLCRPITFLLSFFVLDIKIFCVLALAPLASEKHWSGDELIRQPGKVCFWAEEFLCWIWAWLRMKRRWKWKSLKNAYKAGAKRGGMRLLSEQYRQAGRQEGRMLRASYIVSLTPLWSTEWDPVFKNKTEYSSNKTFTNVDQNKTKSLKKPTAKVFHPWQYPTVST